MNRSVEDLISEREVARSAVERFAPITRAWAFEAEPASSKPLLDAYLDEVKTCDLLILIVGATLTEPVLKEYQTATEYQLPVLAFFKSVPELRPEVEQLRASFPAKWDSFVNPADLREKVQDALGTQLLRLVRGGDTEVNRPGDRLARLRVIKGKNRFIRVTPMVNRPLYNQFRIDDVTSTVVKLHKISNNQEVTIQASRIEDVLDNGANAEPTIVLNGRLQFLTLRREWQFFPEKPPANDPHGIGLGATQSAIDHNIYQRIDALDLVPVFSLPEHIPDRIRERCEVFFDDQGFHWAFGEQILLVRPKRPGE